MLCLSSTNLFHQQNLQLLFCSLFFCSFCSFGDELIGSDIDGFDMKVCDIFKPKLFYDQLCYDTDLQEIKDRNSVNMMNQLELGGIR